MDNTPRTDATDRSARDQGDERAIPVQLRSPQSKLVYLYLTLVSEAHVTELKESLQVDLLTLYPVLNALREHGLVERRGMTYRCCP